MTARKTSTHFRFGSYLRFGQLLTLILLVGLCLFLLRASHSLPLVHASSVPVERLLNQDGTLKLNTEFAGTLDIRGWDVKLDAKRGPILTRQNQKIRDIDTGTTNTWASNSPHILPNVSQTASWSALSNNGLDEIVKAFAVIGNDLYVGGWFSNTYDRSVINLNGIARYSNRTWLPLANQGLGAVVNGVLHVGVVEALAVMGSDLYVGGHFDRTYDGSVTNLHNIARYSNGAWSPLTNQGLDGAVYALAVMGSDLYVGGGFHRTYNGSVTDLNGIARYSNGTWSPLANQGLDVGALALAVMGSDLYVGGGFHRTYDGAVTDLNDIARYSNGTWSPLANQGLGGVPNVGVEALAVMGSDLYVGGSFIKTYDGSVSDLTFIARYSNGTWSPLPNRGLDSIVHALAVIGSDLYVGGHFDSTADNSVEGLTHIARYSNGTWSPLPNRGLVEESYPLGRVLELAVMGSDLYVGGFFDKTDVGSVTNLNNIAVLTDAASPAPTPTPQVCPIQASSSNEADTDGDSLLDCWETNGYDVNGEGTPEVDLPAMGADPNRKDIFVEIDYMQTTAHSHKPNEKALADVKAAFSSANINLHYFVDEAISEITPISFDSGSTQITPAGAFDDLKLGNPINPCGTKPKDAHFGTVNDRGSPNCTNIIAARRDIFRYAIFGHDQAHIPNSSGRAELPGNDFLITLGGLSDNDIKSVGGQRSAEAGTFMHELGHTLGLKHGGGDLTINCKPNYLSIMSYSFQFVALDPLRPLDYSRKALPTLNEVGLDESIGVNGPAGRYTVYGVGGTGVMKRVRAKGSINWNGTGGSNETNVMADVNYLATVPGCVSNPSESLNGYDDWSNLVFNFRTSPDFADGLSRTTPVAEPLTGDDVFRAADSIDADDDGYSNARDNCPAIYNPDQTDTDGDGVGDACQLDTDDDGFPDQVDNCPIDYNPSQLDTDDNEVGDACQISNDIYLPLISK